jgi:hypothetical protein
MTDANNINAGDILSNVDDLIQGGGTDPSGELSFNIPEDVSDEDVSKLNAILEGASGGRLKSLEDIPGILGNAEKLPSLQARLGELQAKLEESPWASPLAKEVNDFLAKGGTPEQLHQMLSFGKMDLSNMQDIDAIREKIRFEKPFLGPDEIDALVKKDVGRYWEEKDGEGNLIAPDPAAKAELKLRGAEARKWLEEMAEKSKTPAQVVDSENARKQQEAIQTAFGKLTNHVASTLESVAMNVPVGGDKDPFQHNFKLTDDQRSAIAPLVQGMAINAFKQGKLSLDVADFQTKSLPAMKKMFEQVAYTLYGPQITESAVKAALGVATVEAKKEERNLPPRQQQKPAVKATMTPEQIALRRQLLERG